MVACDSAIWNGNVYDSSGIYLDTLQTIVGCDSIITMDLTINYTAYTTDSMISCDSAVTGYHAVCCVSRIVNG